MTRDKCRYGAVLLLVLALALVGCATGGGSTAAPEGLPVGTRIALPADAKALGDVACEFYKSGSSQGLEQFEIRCPGWAWASAAASDAESLTSTALVCSVRWHSASSCARTWPISASPRTPASGWCWKPA